MLLKALFNRCFVVLLMVGASSQLKAAVRMDLSSEYLVVHRRFLAVVREGDVDGVGILLSVPSIRNSTILGALRIAIEAKQYLILTLLRNHIQRSNDRSLRFSASIIIEEFATTPPGGDI